MRKTEILKNLRVCGACGLPFGHLILAAISRVFAFSLVGTAEMVVDQYLLDDDVDDIIYNILTPSGTC